ncbi:MAG: outer membrane protein transport protein [Planctomycetota bacterium]|nr:outer membrane protein transport protein [Planctomycetota bacterium]
MIRFTVLIFFLTPVSLWAQLGGEVTGDSARMAAMAGAGLAGGAEVMEAARNPAMLGFLFSGDSSWRMEMNLRGVSTPMTGVTAMGDAFSTTGHSAVGPFLAFGTSSHDLSWGFFLRPTSGGKASMLRTTDLNLAATETEPDSGIWIPNQHDVLTQNEMVQVAGEASMAWRMTPNLSFGFGLSVRSTLLDMSSATDVPFADLQGEVPGMGGLSFGEFFTDVLIPGSGREGIDSFQVDYTAEGIEADPLLFAQLGLAWQPDAHSRVGLWFRPPSTSTDLDGRIHVDMSADIGDILEAVAGIDETSSDFDIHIRDVTFPMQAGFAYAWGLRQKDRFHAQTTWTQWSTSFDGWKAILDNPSSEDMGTMLGEEATTSVDLDMKWADTITVSIGWEHDFQWFPASWRTGKEWRLGLAPGSLPHADATFRAGLGWGNNPMRGTAMAGLMPFNQWHVGTGVSILSDQGQGEWFLSSVVALPAMWKAGENKVLSDFSGDEYSQANYSVILGYRFDG